MIDLSNIVLNRFTRSVGIGFSYASPDNFLSLKEFTKHFSKCIFFAEFKQSLFNNSVNLSFKLFIFIN